jgi:hypothetical protein
MTKIAAGIIKISMTRCRISTQQQGSDEAGKPGVRVIERPAKDGADRRDGEADESGE